jgi:curved DNA-binding protein CbpA
MRREPEAVTPMATTKNYYAILEVRNDASYEIIKKAWRDKARQWHPDKFLADAEKLAAHSRFVELLEAYSVLIDVKKRAAYDLRFSAMSKVGSYAGYENANPDQDQKEAADWFQKILKESPSEFAKTTILVLIMCPVTLIVWLGLMGIIIAMYDVLIGKSSLGLGGAALLFVLFFPSLFLSLFGALMLKDLYYRIKRIVLWIVMRAKIKRLFSSLFGRKPGRSVQI